MRIRIFLVTGLMAAIPLLALATLSPLTAVQSLWGKKAAAEPIHMTVVEKIGGDTRDMIVTFQSIASMFPAKSVDKGDKLTSVDDSEGEAADDVANAEEAAERKGRFAQQ